MTICDVYLVFGWCLLTVLIVVLFCAMKSLKEINNDLERDIRALSVENRNLKIRCDNLEYRFDNVVEQYKEEHEPHLISVDDFYFQNSEIHDKYYLEYVEDLDELRYYTGEVSYIVVDNVDEVIGEGLKFFGLRSKDDNTVYVRNPKFDADFKIVKKENKENGTEC